MAKKARTSEGKATSAVEEAPKSKSFDAELDALFASAAKAEEPARVASTSAEPLSSEGLNKKRKVEEEDVQSGEEEGEEEDDEEEAEELSALDSEEEDVQRELDALYEDAESDSDDEPEAGQDAELVHETAVKQADSKKRAKRKADLDAEPQEVRDRRSVFVGNLPVSMIQNRQMIRALKRHLIQHSPYPSATHVEVVRFRSIPFATPTDDYEARHPEEAEKNMRKRNRSQAYKEARLTEQGVDPKAAHLTGSQKRKIAFITQKVNEKADTVNAYITLSKLSDKLTSTLREHNDDDKVNRLSSNILAAMLARCAHNSLFEGRHLRVDLVTSLQPHEVIESGLDKVKTADGGMLGAVSGSGSVDQESRRKTAFVGNLDFEMREEEVRSFFNELLTKERGVAPIEQALDFSACDTLPKPEQQLDDDDMEGPTVVKQNSWVQDVRIIRDSATQMGKGFAYVRFVDATCVDELMAIHESEEALLAAIKSGQSSSPEQFRRKLKLKGRPLRVSRCKVPKGHVTPGRPGQRKADAGAFNSNTRTPRPNGKQQTNPNQRSRSTGAPTPGGTSPFAKRQKFNNHSAHALESPTRPKASPKAAAQAKVSNPPPQSNDPLKAARVAHKKADAERQARRMAKKSNKRLQEKMQRVANESGGANGKVSLKPKANAGSKKNAPRSSAKPRSGGISRTKSVAKRSLGLLTLLASIIALHASPVQANNEIVNFGPIMCAADEMGHLQDNAARRISQSWPVLRASSGVRLFTLDPIERPEVWLTLQLVSDADDQRNITEDIAAKNENAMTIEDIRQLASAGLPLFDKEHSEQDRRSPRDRWLANVPRWVAWHVWQKRFSFRVNWPANFPIHVRANVYDAMGMMAKHRARMSIDGRIFEMHKRTRDENIDSPLWPCPRLYVHLSVRDGVVPIPPRRYESKSRIEQGMSAWGKYVYDAVVEMAERYAGGLNIEPLQGQGVVEPPSSFPVPVHLLLEPVYLGFVPHTALYLLAVLFITLSVTYVFVTPLVLRGFEKILAEEEDAAEAAQDQLRRKND